MTSNASANCQIESLCSMPHQNGHLYVQVRGYGHDVVRIGGHVLQGEQFTELSADGALRLSRMLAEVAAWLNGQK